MSLFEKHVFICTNQREEGHPSGCCFSKDSAKIVEALKEKIAAAGLKSKVRINKSGCLSQCSMGATMVIYPEGVWYSKVTLSDVDEIFQSLLKGTKVDRLLHPIHRR